MLNGRTLRQSGLILGFGVMISLFQNCAQHPGGLQGGTGISNSSSGVQVVAAASYTQVAFNSQAIPGAAPDLKVDFNLGTINGCHFLIASDGNPADANLAALKSLLSSVRVCQPAPLSGDQVSCMGMSVPDIDLGSGTATVSLAKLFCNSGTFLCDGNDAILRGLLAKLKLSPPACQ